MNAKTVQSIFFGANILLLAYLNYLVFIAFLEPLVWAALLAVFFWPVNRRLRKRWRNKPSVTSLVSVVVVVAVLEIPLGMVAVRIVKDVTDLSPRLTQAEIAPGLQRITDWVSATMPIEFEVVRDKLTEAAAAAGLTIAQWSAETAGGVIAWVLAAGIFLLALFYFFRDGPSIIEYLQDVSPLERQTTGAMLGGISSMVTATIQGQGIVSIAQGACTVFTFWVLSVPGAILWGVVAAVMAFLPLVGPAFVWIPAAVVLFIQGSIGKGVGMLLLGVFLISGIDNVLRPWLLTGRAELHGMLAIVSVFGGVYAFGALGLILGPAIVAVTMGALQGYRNELVATRSVESLAPGNGESAPSGTAAT